MVSKSASIMQRVATCACGSAGERGCLGSQPVGKVSGSSCPHACAWLWVHAHKQVACHALPCCGPRCMQELRVLGRGASGVVVQAVNRLDGRPYAVKKIVMRAASPAARARLMREVSTLARLHHPGIVRYYQARHRLSAAHLRRMSRPLPGRCQAHELAAA